MGFRKLKPTLAFDGHIAVGRHEAQFDNLREDLKGITTRLIGFWRAVFRQATTLK
jgi:hypothetical protein